MDDIIKAIEKGSFGIYVGAGISSGSGMPNWESLLSELIDIIEKKRMVPERIEEMRELLKNPNKYLMIAEEIRDLIQKDLENLIRDRFEDRTKLPTKTHDIIVKLKSKFILTTNYDTLIEKALVKNYENHFPTVYTYKNSASINYSLWNNDHFVLKAHGDAKSPKEIILTEKDYRHIIHNLNGYQSILHAIFSTNSILFVGASLNDPELLLLLGYIHNIFHGGSPTHYALLSETSITQTEIDRWRKDFNIECITYNPKENHKELEEYLQNLLDATGENVFIN